MTRNALLVKLAQIVLHLLMTLEMEGMFILVYNSLCSLVCNALENIIFLWGKDRRL